MTWRTPATLAFGVALGISTRPPLAASQPDKPPRGSRVAVVAYHDSRLLTLCPVLGDDVIETAIFSSRMRAKAAVFYPPIDMQAMAVTMRLEDERLVQTYLPVPAGRTQTVGPGIHHAPEFSGYLERLARDFEVERRLAAQFRARKAYTVVDSLDDADLVFIAESLHTSLSLGSADSYPSVRVATGQQDSPERIFSDSDNEWRRRMDWREAPDPVEAPAASQPAQASPVTIGVIGGDRHTNWRESILAVVVPRAVFSEHAGDGAALSSARLWQGLSASGVQRSGDRRTMKAASPEELVDRFHERNAGLPAYLPVCAATAGVIRSIHDPGEAEVGPAATAGGALPGPAVPTTPTGAQGQTGPRFRSSVMFVTVPVTVTDRSGAVVRDLPSAAFRIFEDEAEQKVERLESGTVASDVALLVDTSAGMRVPREQVRTSAAAFAAALRAADRAMVVKFGSRVQVLSEFTADRSGLQAALAQAGPGGGTRLYDALALVAVDRLARLEGRKAIVLLTDGIDTQSQLTSSRGALTAVNASGSPVYVIRYETADAGAFPISATYSVRRWLLAPPERPGQIQMARAEADQYLMELSSATGGRLYAALPDASVPEVITHIGQELTNQTVLAYYPTNDKLDGTYRKIRVTVDCEGCTVRARSGYRAGIVR